MKRYGFLKNLAAVFIASFFQFYLCFASQNAVAGAVPPYNYHYGIIAADSVAASITGTTTATTLKTYTVPANSMGSAGLVRVTIQWSYTSNADGKTVALQWGGNTVYSSTQTNNAGDRTTTIIANRGVTNQQVAWPSVTSFGQTSAVPITTAVDTTAAVTIALVATLAVAADTITVESVLIEEILP